VISKWGIVVLGLVALAVALLLKGIINSLMFAYTIYTAGLIPIVIAGFLQRKAQGYFSRRSDSDYCRRNDRSDYQDLQQ